MGKFDEMKRLLQRRINDRSDDEYTYPIWQEEIKEFRKNLDDTFEFIKNVCTDEELFEMSEIFEDICGVTHSKEFVEVVRERVKTIDPNLEVFSQNVKEEVIKSINEAEGWLESDTPPSPELII